MSPFFPDEPNPRDFTVDGNTKRYAKEVDNHRVKAAIWRMRPLKAPGPDGICARMLRQAWPTLGDSITRLFRNCIRDASFPQGWMRANLVIIPKPGKKDLADSKSYRPVSLLPTLGKALETIIIQDLVEKTGLDNIGEQHGFVPEGRQ